MIDNTLLYKGFNSYELDVGEALRGTTLDVALYSHISLQVVAIKLSGTAAGKFNVRWLDAEDERIGAAVEVDFNVGNKWSRKTATLEAPEGAEKAEVALANSGDTKFHISCPMAEAGEIATGYDPSLADKVSWHDATGSYVGFLRADQIVAGVLRSVDGKVVFDLDEGTLLMGDSPLSHQLYFDGTNLSIKGAFSANQITSGILQSIIGDSGLDLEAPKLWMKSTDGNTTWEATPANPLAIKDKNGNLLSGLIDVGGQKGLISPFVGNSSDLAGGYGSVGWGQSGGAGFQFHWQGHNFIFTFDVGYGVQLYLDDVLRQAWHKNGGTVLYDANAKGRLALWADGTAQINDNNEANRYKQDSTETSLRTPDQKNIIGVDGTGPFFIKNNSPKSYLIASPTTEDVSHVMTRDYVGVVPLAWKAYKYGNIMQVFVPVDLVDTGFTKLMTINTGYRPKYRIGLTWYSAITSSDANKAVQGYINAAGDIYAIALAPLPTNKIYFTATYII